VAAPGAPPAESAPRDPAPPAFDDTATDRGDDAARLGNPSFVWRSGQERRLAMVARFVPLRGARVLDLGCGVGEYVRAFAREGAEALGLDVAPERLAEARRRLAADPPARRDGGPEPGAVVGLFAAAGEALPLPDGSLDAVVLNEVIEHVADDDATLREVARALRPGGACVIFAPNRLYPFETHGIYLGRRYVFGNIPFVNWLPSALRDRLVPHARAYRHGDWRRLSAAAGLELAYHGYVYPGFDNIAARWPRVARVVRAICYRAEHTPAARLGLSHLVVLRRPAEAGADAAQTPAATS
jgi:SAM-dependent methyltransferase